MARSAQSHDGGTLGGPDLQSDALVRPAARSASAGCSNRVSQETRRRSQNGDGRRGKNRGRSCSLAAAYDWFHSKINFFTASRRDVFWYLFRKTRLAHNDWTLQRKGNFPSGALHQINF